MMTARQIAAVAALGIAALVIALVTLRGPDRSSSSGPLQPLDQCAGVAIPILQGRVTDLAYVLAPDDKLNIEAYLDQFEENSGSQIAVLLMPRLGPTPIDTLGTCTLNAWALGRRNIDDGALILFAVAEQAVRIDVGCGLETIIPDARAQKIVREITRPAMARAAWRDAAVFTIEALVRRIESARLPPRGSPLPARPVYRTPPHSLGCSNR